MLNLAVLCLYPHPLVDPGAGNRHEEEEVEGNDQLEYTEENMERAQEIAQILDTDGAREEDEPMEA